jgi:hypothetical protein
MNWKLGLGWQNDRIKQQLADHGENRNKQLLHMFHTS